MRRKMFVILLPAALWNIAPATPMIAAESANEQ